MSPGGQGRSTEVIDGVTALTLVAGLAVAAEFLRYVVQSRTDAIKPLGSSDQIIPIGNPCEVTGLLVPGTTTKPLPTTFTLVTC